MTGWKPTLDEAAFLGQLLAIDAGLADIARAQLAKGIPLREVVAGFKAASDIARLVRGASNTDTPNPIGDNQ